MALPSFREIPANLKGNRLYEWQVDPRFRVYVSLHPHHLGDIFIVEVAWTKGQPFPGGYSGPNGSVEKDFERFRLSDLWNERAPLDLWWIGGRPKLDPLTGTLPRQRPEAELLAEAETAADDAVDRLVSIALPYLSNVARKLGHEMADAATPRA
jgi:hypothetical protein